MVTAVPDVKIIPISDDIEFILLACDGIWDCKSSLSLVQHYYSKLQSSTLQSLAKININLLDSLCPAKLPNRGFIGTDNMTIIDKATLLEVGTTVLSVVYAP